jgi:hypothetical protein
MLGIVWNRQSKIGRIWKKDLEKATCSSKGKQEPVEKSSKDLHNITEPELCMTSSGQDMPKEWTKYKFQEGYWEAR